VVVTDTQAGGAGFTDGELAGFGAFFDDEVYPLLSEALGPSSDVDENGRVILFFTPASNQLAPAGSSGVVGGFFWGGDLFPAEGPSGEACPSSTEAEILYLSVPDPNGTFGNPISAEGLYTRATIAHEYQHLVNAAQRIFFTDAEELEETWLNEGLSYITEELLFYQLTGLEPGGFRAEESLQAEGAVEEFNEFVYNSVGRYNVYLLGPHFHSVRGTDGIETRGAAWSFLRYAMDRSPRSDAQVLRALLSSSATGLDNLGAALGADPLPWIVDWTVTAAAADLADRVPDRFRQPSWDMANVMRELRPDRRYPLAAIPVPPDQGLRFTLRTGGAGYGAVRLVAGQRARLEVRPVASGAPVRAFLVALP
jgi:hypothetical protein